MRPRSDRLPAVVVGAGPAGLMAAERLARTGVKVTVLERMPSPARKFLIAGRGGLNLAHSEALPAMLPRYGVAASSLAPAILKFDASAVREWCAGLGVETFTGSSGRIFPVGLKASPLLRAWLRRLDGLGVTFRFRTRWTGIDGDGLLWFEEADGDAFSIDAACAVFALGGASWPKLGADGGWTKAFAGLGVDVAPLRPSNCGFEVAWSESFANRFAGQPLKRVGMSFRGRQARGEAMVTRGGIEGGLVYAFSADLRAALEAGGEARPTLDLRPDVSAEGLVARIAAPRGKRSLSTHLAKTAGLPPVAIGLLREAGAVPSEPAGLAARIKALPLALTATTGMTRAISTAGGVTFDAVDEAFMLKARPGVYVVGEMLDWEAPTGGYLLHACLAMGRRAGDAAAARIAQSEGAGLAPILDSTAGGISS